MPEPKDKNDLQRLIGMATYLGRFCENSIEWQWESPQIEAFQKLRNAFVNFPVLRLFDYYCNKPMVISVDASPTGLGAVLLQENQPVCYSSGTLTSTQKRYCQLEKELRAIQFGLNRFSQYIHGQKVTVETDHKPLVGLLTKPMTYSSPIVQRIRLQLQRHDFQLVYKPGKERYIADTLSRAANPKIQTNILPDGEACNDQVHVIITSIAPAASTRTKFAEATAADPTLVLVKELTAKGWPSHKRNCPNPAKPFWDVRHWLSESYGLLMKGDRIVVPLSLRPEVLKQIYDGHFGITNCVERAKSSVYWSGYDDAIRNMVSSCNLCQKNRNSNPASAIYPTEIPEYPFQKVTSDLFEFRGDHYLLVVYYYSKWPCVTRINSLTTSAVVKELERIFTDFGCPEVLISDNGPQYGSAEFRQFCSQRQINHKTSSPEYPQSNGLAERFVQTAKKNMLKIMAEGRPLQDCLSAMRSTPIEVSLPSPSVLLQARNLRGKLPFLPSSLKPKVVDTSLNPKQLQVRGANASFQQFSSTKLPFCRSGKAFEFG